MARAALASSQADACTVKLDANYKHSDTEAMQRALADGPAVETGLRVTATSQARAWKLPLVCNMMPCARAKPLSLGPPRTRHQNRQSTGESYRPWRCWQLARVPLAAGLDRVFRVPPSTGCRGASGSKFLPGGKPLVSLPCCLGSPNLGIRTLTPNR